MPTTTTALGGLAHDAVELTGASSDYDKLLELVGDRRFVLLALADLRASASRRRSAPVYG